MSGVRRPRPGRSRPRSSVLTVEGVGFPRERMPIKPNGLQPRASRLTRLYGQDVPRKREMVGRTASNLEPAQWNRRGRNSAKSNPRFLVLVAGNVGMCSVLGERRMFDTLTRDDSDITN